jgi:hypothetical protein
MTRPSKEAVETALTYAAQLPDSMLTGPFHASMSALADEVRALSATIDRVGTLPATWRERFGLLMHDERIRLAKESCARDLEHALQVTP